MKNHTTALPSAKTLVALPGSAWLARILTYVRALPGRSMLILGILMLSTGLATAQVCPSVGQDTGCGTIITITDTGATVSSTGQPPYDGIEDTLVGVVNNSSQPVRTLGLRSALSIFDFDGDGIVTYGIPGNSFDSTGYGGPNAYFTNISGDLKTGTINFIVPIAARGGTAYFSLEEAISSATSCSSVINNAVHHTVNGTEISATFTPNSGYTLAQAAQLCGFTDFNWQQTVTSLPLPNPFFAAGSTAPLKAPPPFNDPPPGGYAYQNPPNAVIFPIYYNLFTPASNSLSLAAHKTSTTLSFYDAPADRCLPGGSGAGCGGQTAPAGSKLAFTTHLVGIVGLLPGVGVQDTGIGFTWTDTFNGPSGGISVINSNQPVDPGSGTGGITLTSSQGISTYEYNGVTVNSVNGVPVSTLTVAIQIKPPAAAPVSINPKAQGVIPVAILSAPDFDAATVEAGSVHFGPDGAINSSPSTLQDVDGDGLPDLVLHFKSEQTGIACGDTSVTLNGRTDAGKTFVGKEDIRTVSCK